MQVIVGHESVPGTSKTSGGARPAARIPLGAAASLLFSPLLVSNAFALDVYRAADFDIRWDNTLAYTASFRIEPRDNALLVDPNADDGDRDFSPGVISDRFDLLTQLEVTMGSTGIRLSAAAWYDTAYHGRNDNDSPLTFNPFSVPHDHFTRAVEVLQGKEAELVDGFAYTTIEVGGMPLSLRVGRHTLSWGESLFFADNGIASGQAPIDEAKEAQSPDTYARDAFLPVAQASGTLQVNSNVAVSAYYQFEWRKSREPGSGSYFSNVDYLDEGGERFIVSPGVYLFRAREQKPPSSGQFGIAVQTSTDDYSYGFYVLRFHAKDPEVYLRPTGVVVGGNAGQYDLVYPQGIWSFGASYSGYLGDANLAGEASVRLHMPLVADPITVPQGAVADGSGHPLYPLGDTFQAQVSLSETLAPAAVWNRADFQLEVASNDVLAVTRNASARDPTRDGFALAARAEFAPQYFEVLPGLNLTVPLSIGYGLIGSSSIDAAQYEGAGDVEIGLQATFQTVWQAHLTLTHFIGTPEQQPYSDRDFVSLHLQRTF